MQRQQHTMQNGSGLELRIRQKNMNKSLIVQTDMLHRLDLEKFDVTAIQEPYLDLYYNTHANHHWYTVYPREHYVEPRKTRSVILMNRRLSVDTWMQVEFGSSDITAVQI